MIRRLVSTRRTVPESAREDYDMAWTELKAAAELREVHAWRFAAESESGSYLEFLEFRREDPRDEADFMELLSGLEAIATGAVEEWVEA